MPVTALIAEAISSGDLATAAERVVAALHNLGPMTRAALATEAYVPQEYPKWVHGHVARDAESEAFIRAVHERSAAPAASLPIVPPADDPVDTPAEEVVEAPEAAAKAE